MFLRAIALISAFLFLPLHASAQGYRFSPTRTQAQVDLWQSLERPWGSDTVPAAEAYKVFEDLIAQDLASRQLVSEFDQRLRSRGVDGIKSVIDYCGTLGENVGGQTRHSTRLVEMVADFEGYPARPWKAETQKAVREGFAHREVKFPFFKGMVVAAVPRICLGASDSIRGAYDILIHEVVHAQRQDTIAEFLSNFELESSDDAFDGEMDRRGGEIDAYRAGIRAEARLVARLGVLNPGARYPDFQGDDGEVNDETHFRDYVRRIYGDLYLTTAGRADLIDGARDLQQWMINALQTSIRPFLVQRRDVALVAELDAEVLRLQTRLDQLQ